MAYALTAPGKRVRAALLLAAYRESGGTGDAAHLAAAVEIVHTYSLVHDDLPCMDDDDVRRGRPTVHRRFDVPTAAEAGYRLVPLAARSLHEGAQRAGAAERVGELGRVLFRAAGVGGMIGGQVRDLEAEGRAVTMDELVALHRTKTGAVIAASVDLGAVAAGAPPPRRAALRAYGEAIGLAFQITDDVLDITASSTALGKTAGKDRAQAKATFVASLGVDGARAEAARQLARGMDRLGAAEIDSSLLRGIATFIVERRA